MAHTQHGRPVAKRSSRRAWVTRIAATVSAVLCLSLVDLPSAAAATPLTGTFTLAAGSCGGGSVSGTYLRMILPSGGLSGPYMSNSDSTCSDQSYTPLSAGTDSGLVSGSYQSTPNPPFDSSGNARAGRITAPARFYGTSFATSSNQVDPQTKVSAAAPRVWVTGGRLSADLRAFSVTWNNQYFNQGAPKPNGSYPGNTRAASGTYDASSGAFALQWTSQVVGGPFDKFTGQWHLVGRFVPASAGAGAADPGAAAGGGTGGGQGGNQGAGQAPAGQAPAGQAADNNNGNGGAPAAGPAASSAHARSSAPARPGTSTGPQAAANAATVNPALAASTTTVSHDRWKVSWWVIVLVAAIAVLGLGALLGLGRLARKGSVAG